MTDAAPPQDMRPEGHPEHLPWPPEVREYPHDHPERRDEESKEAFNEDWAREDFGDALIDELMRGHRHFCGDWWLLALLVTSEQVAAKQDPKYIDSRRFSEWSAAANELQSKGSCIHLECVKLNDMRLDHIKFERAHLEKAWLAGARLNYADLWAARLAGVACSDAQLIHANFSYATLDDAELCGARCDYADLRSSSLVNAALHCANLYRADLSRADISGAGFEHARLVGVRGLFGKDRARTRSRSVDEHEAQNAIYRYGWDFGSWEFLRMIGSLRLFGVSYISVIVIAFYVGFARQYNAFAAYSRGVAGGRDATPEGSLDELWVQIVAKLPNVPAPGHLGRQLIATLCLAVAATIYALCCPSEVKEANEVRWTRAMNQPLWEYRSANWSRIWWRYACWVFFVVGGLYTLCYIGARCWDAMRYLMGW